MSETLRVVTTLEILSLTRAQRKIFYQTVLNLFHQLSPLRCISGLKVRRKQKEREHSLPIMRACTMNNRETYQCQGFACSKPFLGHIMHNGQEHSPFIRDVYRDLYRLGSNVIDCTKIWYCVENILHTEGYLSCEQHYESRQRARVCQEYTVHSV